MTLCRDCGKLVIPESSRKRGYGYVDQCDECAKPEVRKFGVDEGGKLRLVHQGEAMMIWDDLQRRVQGRVFK